MSELPIVSSLKLTKVIIKLGFKEIRQKGSHKIFSHSDGRLVVIPMHSNKPVPEGLLNKIIKQDLRLSKDEFLDLL
ncbi:MAG TPA: type II toxin-antitoxin system HicA family toxin [archaeon]|jgi:predicted RNA binding protein YcfA (HicA-like mRNA interferase family)|nr:type II toxin-antitoxin system HicA family toxin [archaeon]